MSEDIVILGAATLGGGGGLTLLWNIYQAQVKAMIMQERILGKLDAIYQVMKNGNQSSKKRRP